MAVDERYTKQADEKFPTPNEWGVKRTRLSYGKRNDLPPDYEILRGYRTNTRYAPKRESWIGRTLHNNWPALILIGLSAGIIIGQAWRALR